MLPEARVAVESFRPYYDHIMRYARNRFQRLEKKREGLFQGASGHRPNHKSFVAVFHTEDFLGWSGLTITEWKTLEKHMSERGEVHSVLLSVADKLMTAYGIPEEVCNLYLVVRCRAKGNGGEAYSKIERELCQAA